MCRYTLDTRHTARFLVYISRKDFLVYNSSELRETDFRFFHKNGSSIFYNSAVVT